MRTNRQNPLRGSDIRERNEKIILALISRQGRLSQSDAVELTGLKPPTVLRIFTKLEAARLIRVAAVQQYESDRKGRRPVYYEVVPESVYVVGLDFWAENAAIIIVDFAAKPVYSGRLHFEGNLTADELTRRLIGFIGESIAAGAVDENLILGIGIGAPGSIDTGDGSVVYCARIDGMVEYPLAEKIRERFCIPVLVNNNTNVIALNAWHRGEMKGMRSFLTILIRSGVGGAFLQEGNLLLSGRQTAFELGRLSVPRDSFEPDRDGCCSLEECIAEGPLLNETTRLSGIDTLEALDRAIEAGDRELLACLDIRARLLSGICSDLYHLLNPEAVLLISRSTGLARFLAARLDVHFHEVCDLPSSVARLAFIGEVYDPVQACIGASRLIFEAYFNSSLISD